jgi:hypothetical protein
MNLKLVVVVYFKILSGGSEENHEEPQLVQPVSRLKLKLGPPDYEAKVQTSRL